MVVVPGTPMSSAPKVTQVFAVALIGEGARLCFRCVLNIGRRAIGCIWPGRGVPDTENGVTAVVVERLSASVGDRR